MQTTTSIAEDVFQHHIGSLGNNDLEELMKDYTEKSELWTPEALFRKSYSRNTKTGLRKLVSSVKQNTNEPVRKKGFFNPNKNGKRPKQD